jgi:hypothetical protein
MEVTFLTNKNEEELLQQIANAKDIYIGQGEIPEGYNIQLELTEDDYLPVDDTEDIISGGLTTAQINALDKLFAAAAYKDDSILSLYNNFREAFGLPISDSTETEDL